MARSNEEWIADLHDAAGRDPASRELHRFLYATLARGFGRQLDDADLEDLAQAAVLKTMQRLDDFRGDSRFTTWSASIAVNAALGELRRRRHGTISLDEAKAAGRAHIEQAPSAPGRVQTIEAARVLREAIDQALSPAQREALLAELGGLPLMEIARRTGRKRGALYKLLHDARKRLRTHLHGQGLSAADLIVSGEGDAT